MTLPVTLLLAACVLSLVDAVAVAVPLFFVAVIVRSPVHAHCK